jgi:hypothetical protein
MSATTPGAPSRATAFREPALWILLAVVALYFARPLFGGTLFFRDLYLLFVPQRARLAKLAAAGGLPLWDPFLHGGQPFLADPNNSALYPTAWLSLVLPPVFAANAEIALHFLLGALAAYLLARDLGLSRAASAAGGAAFALCGFTLSLANLFNRALAMPWLPFLLFFWHRHLQTRRRRWLAAAAGAGALQVLTGSPEFLLLSLALAAGWALFFPYGPASGTRSRRLFGAFLLALAVAGLGAVQILPTLPVIAGSARGQPRTFSSFATWSLSPQRLPELVVPGFFGRTDALAPADYWGHEVEDQRFPLFLSVYFGAGLLALAAWAAASRREMTLPAPLRRYLGGAAALALLLAMGRFLPLLPALYRAAPFLGLFRHPTKFLAAATLPLALLAAQGVDDGFGERPASRSLRALLAGAAVGLGLLWLAFAGSGTFVSAFSRTFFRLPASTAMREGVAAGLAHGALATAALALMAFRPARGASRASASLAVAASATLVLDLAAAGTRVNPVAPRALLEETPPAADTVRGLLGGGRLFRDENPAGVVLSAPSNDILWQDAWNRETLYAYVGAAFDLPVIFHIDYDDLAALRLARLTERLRGLPWERRLPALSAGAVTVVVTAQRVTAEGLEAAASIPNASNTPFLVYRNARAAPRAGFVARWESVASPEAALDAVTREGFDPRETALLEGPAPAPPASPCPPAPVAFREARATRVRLSVEPRCAGYLVFADPRVPGWTVRVDGVAAETRAADYAFAAVRLEPGAHEIERTYGAGRGLGAGAAISAGTLVVLLFVKPRRATPRAGAA